jgi:hypothetical protein
MTSPRTKSASYEVGYGKPPRHTQFQKGRSGNPRGRPPRDRVRRMKALVLKEAFRGIAIDEGGLMVPATAMQAILRGQIEIAISGDGVAQRAIVAAVRAIEKENEQPEMMFAPDHGPRTDGHETDEKAMDGEEELDAAESNGTAVR